MTDRISKLPTRRHVFPSALLHLLFFPVLFTLEQSHSVLLSSIWQDQSRVGPGGSDQWKSSHREQPHSSRPAGNDHTGAVHTQILSNRKDDDGCLSISLSNYSENKNV